MLKRIYILLNETALFYKALSEPLRLRILNILLHHKEVCVCDLVTFFNTQQGMVSRHLSYMRKAGIVTSQSKGTWRYYSLHPTLRLTRASLLLAIESDFASNSELKQEQLNFNKSICGA